MVPKPGMTTQLDETGHVEIVLPECHWCRQPLDGCTKDGMHLKCAEEFAVNWDLVVNYGGQSIRKLEE